MSLDGKIGDVIGASPTHVGDSRRVGEILEVLGMPGHGHFRVRWEDGHESLFYPGTHGGVVRRTKPATKPSSSASPDPGHQYGR